MIFILALQALFLPPSLSQIRPEELTESIRHVLWLDYGQYVPGATLLVGYYLPLQVFYHVFGFSFEIAKLFRFGLDIISITCLALLLRKRLLPLITIGLSPTILFFNSLSVQYGIDLQYLPILLFLAKTNNLWVSVLFGMIYTVAYNSYAGFLSLAPALIILFIWQNRRWTHWLAAVLGALFMTILLFGQFQDKYHLIHFDKLASPAHGTGKLTWEPQNAWSTILAFTGKPDNYYYEVVKPDLSNVYPWLAVLATLGLCSYAFIMHKYRLPITLASLTIVINLLILSVTSSVTGEANVRRASGIIAGFYALYAVAWVVSWRIKNKFLRWIVLGLLLVLPIHHLLSYIPNYHNLTTPSVNREEFWFHRFGTPSQSLNYLTQRLQQGDLKLHQEYLGVDLSYLYGWAYATLTANCKYNHLSCHRIYAYDPSRETYFLLDFQKVYQLVANFNTR